MLNQRQIADNKECEINEDKECLGCSCSVCLAQVPTDYKSGLRRAIEVLDTEYKDTEWASKIKKRLEEEIKNK